MAIFFNDSFSLKRIIPKRVESRITEMFWSGKNAALLMRPARIVLNRFAPPKQRPATDGKITLRFWIFALFLQHIKPMIDDKNANVKAIIKNSFLSDLYAEFCCTFCIIPNPPDDIIATIIGSTKVLPLLPLFSLPITVTAMVVSASIKPNKSVMVNSSFQKIEPDMVGIMNPSE